VIEHAPHPDVSSTPWLGYWNRRPPELDHFVPKVYRIDLGSAKRLGFSGRKLNDCVLTLAHIAARFMIITYTVYYVYSMAKTALLS